MPPSVTLSFSSNLPILEQNLAGSIFKTFLSQILSGTFYTIPLNCDTVLESVSVAKIAPISFWEITVWINIVYFLKLVRGIEVCFWLKGVEAMTMQQGDVDKM